MATLGEYLGAGASTTKLLLHLNGSSVDSSGNGNNGTDTNITYGLAYGKLGQGASLNGSSSKITIANHENLRPASAFTISAWIYKTNKTSYGIVFNSGYDNSSSPYQFGGIRMYVSNSGDLVGQIGAYGTTFTIGNSGGNINATTWYHIAFTWTGTQAYLYLNGSQLFNTANSTAPSYQTSNAVLIGARQIGASNDLWFGGSIDEVIVENVAWSAEQVKKYYSASKGRWATL